MLSIVVPALYALFVWWLGTGIILYLDRLPERTYRWSLIGAAGTLAAGIYGLVLTSTGVSVAHAYCGFTCAVMIWGALEMSYFMGLVSGPRKAPCPPDCAGWRRFLLAIGTSLYHELSVLATGIALSVLCWGEANQVGVWTYNILWIMRWSAKLNVFLGVPNLHTDWLPDHLRFLQTYMGQRPMNRLFPLSVTVATVGVVLLIGTAQDAAPHSFTSAGYILTATLLGLAVLEHWFLVLPLPDEALWSWAFKRGDSQAGPSPQVYSDAVRERCAPLSLIAIRER
ncbi:putative photosynthetic complex assembly protein PuhE [uncultured Thiodictyon sp.]|uniref:putative photosynthetic complex assembly protein PuhE n=1 Tax=uncultured Thiodictyon sp. TaxID=1846217 RepID=UPI0025CE7ED4|nr:putative photosynthetic complex assembly protein PuhE [uncultured Thiodictyon sp.]